MDYGNDSTAPKIIYPCVWVYAVIGLGEEDTLQDSIKAVMGSHFYTLMFSKRSSQKNYCSFHVECTVKDEEERNRIYQALRKAPHVKMVL